MVRCEESLSGWRKLEPPRAKLPAPRAAVALLAAPSCNREPEVGSPEWCEAESAEGKMDDYTMKEIMLYAQHCMPKHRKP